MGDFWEASPPDGVRAQLTLNALVGGPADVEEKNKPCSYRAFLVVASAVNCFDTLSHTFFS